MPGLVGGRGMTLRLEGFAVGVSGKKRRLGEARTVCVCRRERDALTLGVRCRGWEALAPALSRGEREWERFTLGLRCRDWKALTPVLSRREREWERFTLDLRCRERESEAPSLRLSYRERGWRGVRNLIAGVRLLCP